ncbi:hypothetical protein [Listeria costaricensis]|uniref:hypothetical protein n=1 Tax=Listeria costaricensis TaxID=2026604 RepID=UPI000C073547|nr:hypothetical protein [Listeria costaricensis]
MGTTTIKDTVFNFQDEKKLESFISRIEGKSVTTNKNVQKTKASIKAIKEIKIDGKIIKL